MRVVVKRAFRNAFSAAVPQIGTGKGKVTLRSGIRICLRTVAADYLWQFIECLSYTALYVWLFFTDVKKRYQ